MIRTKHWVMDEWTMCSARDHHQNCRPWPQTTAPPGRCTIPRVRYEKQSWPPLLGGDTRKPLSAAALDGSMLKGPLWLCCHIPEMNRWWWSVSAAIFPDSSSGIPEMHKHQTHPQRRLDDYTESVVRQMHWNLWAQTPLIYKSTPIYEPLTLLLCKLTLIIPPFSQIHDK